MPAVVDGELIDGDLCQRCNTVSLDLRTLWMACFYDMSEYKIPFKEQIVFQTDDDAQFDEHTAPSAITLNSGKKITLSSGLVTTQFPLRPLSQYTLRVCKRCRAEWLDAIDTWYAKKPIRDPDDHY